MPPKQRATPPLVNGVELDNYLTPEPNLSTSSTVHIRPSENHMLPPSSTVPRALQVSQPNCPSPTIPPVSTPPIITPKLQSPQVNGHEPSTPQTTTVTSRYSPVSEMLINYYILCVCFINILKLNVVKNKRTSTLKKTFNYLIKTNKSEKIIRHILGVKILNKCFKN